MENQKKNTKYIIIAIIALALIITFVIITQNTSSSKAINEEEMLSIMNNSNFNIYAGNSSPQPAYMWEYKKTKTYGSVFLFKNKKSANESYNTDKELHASEHPLTPLEYTDKDFTGYYYSDTDSYWIVIKKENIEFVYSIQDKNKKDLIFEIKDEIVKILSN